MYFISISNHIMKDQKNIHIVPYRKQPISFYGWFVQVSTCVHKLIFKKYICTGRNAIVVIISALIAYALASQGKNNVFSLVKKLPEGIPPVKVPTINEEVVKVIIIICVYCNLATCCVGFKQLNSGCSFNRTTGEHCHRKGIWLVVYKTL